VAPAYAARMHSPRKRSFLLIAGLVLAGFSATAAEGWLARPAVPAAIAVPPAAKLVAHFHATGAQVYVCGQAPAGGAYAWTLKQPDAVLFDEAGKKAGTHGAGPTWTTSDGGTVAAKKAAQVDAPAPGSVPWLLLRADKAPAKGPLAGVTHVQRIATKNGAAPATKCDAAGAGSEKRSDYSAEYYFYAAPPA
jgi:hypothetical protein